MAVTMDRRDKLLIDMIRSFSLAMANHTDYIGDMSIRKKWGPAGRTRGSAVREEFDGVFEPPERLGRFAHGLEHNHPLFVDQKYRGHLEGRNVSLRGFLIDIEHALVCDVQRVEERLRHAFALLVDAHEEHAHPLPVAIGGGEFGELGHLPLAGNAIGGPKRDDDIPLLHQRAERDELVVAVEEREALRPARRGG